MSYYTSTHDDETKQKRGIVTYGPLLWGMCDTKGQYINELYSAANVKLSFGIYKHFGTHWYTTRKCADYQLSFLKARISFVH
jgi:hypothetical protein